MKKLIAIALAAIFVSTSASAAVISQNNDGNIAIGGTLGNEYINTETQVQILGPFDKKTTLDESIFKGDVGNVQIMTNTYINTIITDANGNYSFVYNVAEENKYYVVSVTEPGQEMPQTVNLYVIGQENLTRFLDEINAADTIDKMKIVLKKPEYKKLLEDNRSDYATISASKYLTKLASGLLKACPYTGFSEFENSLVQNSAVQLTNLITDATKAEEIASQKLDISGAILLQIFQRFSSFEKTEVFGRMLGREIEDFDAYIKLFDESSFLEQIYIEKYASNLTELITSNAQYFGLDLTEYKKYLQDVNKKLYGCNFKTMDEFKAALKKAILDVTSFPGGNTGGNSDKNQPKHDSTPIVVPSGNQGKTDVPKENKDGYFDDLDSVLWAEKAINALAEKEVISGKADRLFFPLDNVKREEFTKMTVSAFAMPKTANELNFEDVNIGDWYYESIVAGFANGIVNGKSDKLFGIGELITRQDMAVILYRAALKKGLKFDLKSEKFSDDNLIFDYAKEAVYALKNKGVISGVGENCFEPLKEATRAEAAKMIYSIIIL